MAIFTDSIGNKFIGNAVWANHDLSYQTKFLTSGIPRTMFTSELNSLFTALNYQNKLVYSGTWDTNLYDMYEWRSAFDTESTFRRYGIRSDNAYALYNLYNGSNVNFTVAGMGGDRVGVMLGSTFTTQGVELIACATETTLCTLFFNSDKTNGRLSFGNNTHLFSYTGLLEDVNTNFNYYSANNMTKSIGLGLTGGLHMIGNDMKSILTTGDAQYPIVCADSQTPTAQWATDFYVFDNNSSLGFPAIGRVKNLLLATGSYTLGKPVKIQGSAMPDAGFNRWLPVTTLAGKTVLMRCYSSVEI
jgi:hypothetical protein